ncbi:SAM-dependent methyltransferase [Streptomyces tsukubensis]|uniref:SAM-dependent methyltransferase n=1 Tax=Streptomyces tsukubensis TaxID=83656 RepID=UPI0034506D55
MSGRIQEWLLGGTEAFALDREAGAALLEVLPGARELAAVGRRFLLDSVRMLAGRGVGQFLDLGCGLPQQENVHEAAQGVRRGARVVYVESDPAIAGHARVSLEDNGDTLAVEGDLRQMQAVRRTVGGFLDWDRPVAVLLSGVLDCLPADGTAPAALVRDLTRGLAHGSCVVIGQQASDDPVIRGAVTRLMTDATGGGWGRMASPAEVTGCFDGLRTRPPGPGAVRGRGRSPVLCSSGAVVWGGIGWVGEAAPC